MKTKYLNKYSNGMKYQYQQLYFELVLALIFCNSDLDRDLLMFIVQLVQTRKVFKKKHTCGLLFAKLGCAF